MLKRRESKYHSGRADGQTLDWVKAKRMQTLDYIFVEETRTPGNGRTAIWGLYDEKGELVPVMQAGAPEAVLDRCVEGETVCEFKGFEIFRSGAIRSAVFVRIREDKEAKDCRL